MNEKKRYVQCAYCMRFKKSKHSDVHFFCWDWAMLTWSCLSPPCSAPIYTPAGFAISQTGLRFSPWQTGRETCGMRKDTHGHVFSDYPSFYKGSKLKKRHKNNSKRQTRGQTIAGMALLMPLDLGVLIQRQWLQWACL